MAASPPDPPIPGKPTPVADGGTGGEPRPTKGGPDDERRRRRTPEELAGYSFDKVEVRRAIERHFRVYDERDALPGFDRALLVAFYVHADRETIERELPILQDELRALDPQLAPMFREEGGETIIIVARRPTELVMRSSRVPLVLLLLSILTLTAAGSLAWVGFQGSAEVGPMLRPRNILLGFLYFTLPMLFYFGAMEGARRIAARRHRVRLGWSLIIPVPPFLWVPSIGTFGSLARSKVLPSNRRALFDLAAAGPIAGFLAAILIVIVGLQLTAAHAVVSQDDAAMTFDVIAPSGEDWSEAADSGPIRHYERRAPEEVHNAHNVSVHFERVVAGRGYGLLGWEIIVTASGPGDIAVNHTLSWSALDTDGTQLAGNSTTNALTPGGSATHRIDLPPGTERLQVTLEYRVPARTTVPLGEPLAFRGLAHVLVPGDGDYVLHPTGVAGWGALLVTGIILLPVGRLDGGGVARALLGDRMVLLGYATIGALVLLAFLYLAWVYLVLFILLFLSVRHPVPLDDTSPLDPRRRALVLLLVAILVLSFVPVPAQLPGLGLFS